jgi:hypothetical protein
MWIDGYKLYPAEITAKKIADLITHELVDGLGNEFKNELLDAINKLSNRLTKNNNKNFEVAQIFQKSI